jgi:enoyl-CoA hydratase
MNFETLLFEVEENIAIITINRPDKMNALNADVIQELSKAIDEVEKNQDIRSAIITGAGKAFVAGADISEFPSMDPAAGKALAETGAEHVFNKIENCSKPVVAAVNGFALGGGCELAMACHFRVASEKAKFGQPEVNLGLIPGYGGTQRLTALVGKGRAMELCMTAHMPDAVEAEKIGLVNHVTTVESLLGHTKNILGIINKKSPMALSKVIKCVNAAGGDDGFATEIEEFGSCFATPEMKEGVGAFLEKRKADFQGVSA